MSTLFPNCAVLMATCNGERWLPEQLDSIRNQQQVDVHVAVSDDQSTDGSLKVLEEYSARLPLTILPEQQERFGSANRNFLRLIRDAEIGEAAYVALADQDDIWHSDKLARAVARLRSDVADGYSSDVEAFWPDGRTKVIKKSYSLKRFDHVFGSPGPGCTFVLTRALFLNMRDWVTINFITLSGLWVHDWIIYCYARARGFRWIIDNVPTMRYRQHHSNEIGTNSGLKAIQRRLEIVKQGRYRHDIVHMSELTKACPECSLALRRLSWMDRLWLIRHAGDFRRSRPEVIALQIIFLLMPKSPISDAG